MSTEKQSKSVKRGGSRPFKQGELEVILSLVPTQQNVRHLSLLLDRSEGAIELIYRKAYAHGAITTTAPTMMRKVLAAKKSLGIIIGRKKLAKDE